MIIGICTPCRAAKSSDVETRVALLKSVKKENYQLGLEVVGPLSDFQKSAEEIVRNVAEARRQGIEQIVIHLPVTRDNYVEAPTNLSRPESVEILNSVFDIAKRVRAILVNVHLETFVIGDQMDQFTDSDRKQLQEAVSENLGRIKRGSVKLALENMPWPLMGDAYFTKKDMIFEPLSVDPEELAKFAERSAAGLTFDTCHWGTLALPMPLTAAVRRVEHNLSHLHLSDVLGRWIDGSSRYIEGIIPGDGNLGEENFRQLIRYLGIVPGRCQSPPR